MKPILRGTLWLALVHAVIASAATIVTIVGPGAGTQGNQGTYPRSISNTGTIAGYYVDFANQSHGFLQKGAMTTFDAPGAVNTYAYSINSAGAITGDFFDGTAYHGFGRNTSGGIATFDAPGAVGGTFPKGINDAGVIAGLFVDANGASHGFVRSVAGTITTFDAPGAGTGYGQGTLVTSINNAGVIIGHYDDANNIYHGFERDASGAITTFDSPGATNTFAWSINSTGVIAGSYEDSDYATHGYVLSTAGEYTSFSAPAPAWATQGVSIDSAGVVAAEEWIKTQDGGETELGMIRFASGAMQSFAGPKAAGTWTTGINDSNFIVGYYTTAGSVTKGFLLIP
jgi:hypothetical protein